MRGITIAAVLSIAAIGACNRQPDVQKMADGALESVALADEVDASYDDDNRVVHLSGTVPTPDDRNRAHDAVRASVGSLAQVANDIVVDGPGAEAGDDLDAGIEERFETLHSNTADLKGYDIDASVDNAVLTLTGDVQTAADKSKFESMARDIPGVSQVINAIVVKPEMRRPAR